MGYTVISMTMDDQKPIRTAVVDDSKRHAVVHELGECSIITVSFNDDHARKELGPVYNLRSLVFTIRGPKNMVVFMTDPKAGLNSKMIDEINNAVEGCVNKYTVADQVKKIIMDDLDKAFDKIMGTECERLYKRLGAVCGSMGSPGYTTAMNDSVLRVIEELNRNHNLKLAFTDYLESLGDKKITGIMQRINGLYQQIVDNDIELMETWP